MTIFVYNTIWSRYTQQNASDGEMWKTLYTLADGCRELSWEAATERMLDAAELQAGDWPKAASKVAEATLFSAYNAALGTCASCAASKQVHAYRMHACMIVPDPLSIYALMPLCPYAL